MTDSSFKWGTVTAVSPLRVRIDGDTDALPLAPDSLLDTASLAVGDRVRCEMSARRLIVHGSTTGLHSHRPALLDPAYVGPGPARVSFLPGGALSAEAYQWVGKYEPWGNRVVSMVPRGSTWVIAGHSGEEELGGKVALPLANGWVPYNHKNAIAGDRWTLPRAQKLASGIVVLSGLVGYGTHANDTTIAQLPVGYRPDTLMIFPVNNGDTAKSITIYPDGRITTRPNWVANTYVSLDGIAFPAAGVATWTTIGAAGSGSSFANGWTDYGDARFGVARYWKDPYGFTWFAGLIKGGTTSADNWPMVTLPASHGSYAQSHSKIASTDAFGFVSGMPTGLTWKTGTTAATWLSLCGLVLVTPDARANNPWVYPGDIGAYANGWNQFPGGFTKFAYLRRADGLGMSAGLINGGTAPAVKVASLRLEHTTFGEAILYGVSAAAFARYDLYGRNASNDDGRGGMQVQTGSAAWASWDNQMWMVGD